MSGLSTTSPESPIQPRDFRSSSISDKRSKEHAAKWRLGVRHRSGYWPFDEPHADAQHHKLRPAKACRAGAKHHQNKNTVPSNFESHEFGLAGIARMARSIDAHKTVTEHANTSLSASLLSLMPPGSRISAPAIHTVPADVDILYSFDSRGASPGVKASAVHLDRLVDQAEKKWVNDQTEKIVRGEYEVLDERGEITVVAKRTRGRKSPKTKADTTSSEAALDEDDGFELI